MKRKRFKPEQISAILQEYDNGKDVQSIIREHGVSKASFYK
jgi:putative transposase